MRLDFNELSVQTIEVKALDQHGGKTYVLRDDVPMSTMLRCFEWKRLGERWEEALPEGTDPEEAIAERQRRWADVAQVALELCTAIVRHSLPGVTQQEIAETFSTENQNAIIRTFFTLRFRPSAPPTTGTPASAAAVEAPAPAAKPAKKATTTHSPA